VNRIRAETTNTLEPIRVVSVGESAMSTIPAATVRGTTPRCSQPRSFGLTSASVSVTLSTTWSKRERMASFIDRNLPDWTQPETSTRRRSPDLRGGARQ
jgi:hypothetical protein